PRLTESEQRLLGVILIGTASRTLGSDETPAALPPPPETIRAALAPFGGRLEPLADGSAVVTVSGAGDTARRAARAARCALELHALLPDAPLALAAGTGVSDDSFSIGAVIDRAARLLASGAPAGVRVDEVVAALVDTRFDIVRDGAGAALVGERASRGPARLLLGRPTPFVGRDRELRLLEDIQGESAREP